MVDVTLINALSGRDSIQDKIRQIREDVHRFMIRNQLRKETVVVYCLFLVAVYFSVTFCDMRITPRLGIIVIA